MSTEAGNVEVDSLKGTKSMTIGHNLHGSARVGAVINLSTVCEQPGTPDHGH